MAWTRERSSTLGAREREREDHGSRITGERITAFVNSNWVGMLQFPGEVRVPNLTEGIILLDVDQCDAYAGFTRFGVDLAYIPAVAFHSRCFPPRVCLLNAVYFKPSEGGEVLRYIHLTHE